MARNNKHKCNISGRKKFRARICLTIDKKKLDKSRFFDTIEEAIQQRLEWEKEYFKEFSTHANQFCYSNWVG